MKLTFLLFAVFANAAFGQVVVERVKPSQVLYFYDEPARAEIALTNAGAVAVTGDLRVTEEWDLEESAPVWSGPVAFGPGERKVVGVEWMPRKIMYGRALRAVFQPKDGAASERREFFQVADPDDWFRTFLLNGACFEQVKSAENDPFYTYGNFDNHFSYAPSAFACLAPQEDEWMTGQGGGFVTKRKMLDAIRQRRSMGVRQGGYTISSPAGQKGYDLARQHPEWILRDKQGAFNTVGTPVNPLELAQPITQRCTDWYCLYPDFGDPEVVRYAGEEVVRAMKLFGFDAMFFDTAYNIVGAFFNTAPADGHQAIYLWDGAPLGRGQSLDELSARCVAGVDRIVHAALPRAVLWYNGASPREGWVKTHEAALRSPLSGSLLEVQGRQIFNPLFHMHAVRSMYEGFATERDVYLKHKGFDDPVLTTGYMFNLNPLDYMTKEKFVATRDLWTTCNQLGAIYIATRFHPCVLGHNGWRPMAQFMTRYSALLWARDVKPVAKPWKKINVESNREVWWNECVYERDAPAFHDILIHVLNSPENENFDLKIAQDPPPAKHVEVEIKPADPARKARVWALRMYDCEAAIRAPAQTELTPTVESGKLIVELPEFKYHTLVVVREWK